jgi:hypothetical protein
MLINNLNNWFNNNPSSYYASQPNFNLSDYQQIDHTSKTNSDSVQTSDSKSSTNGNNTNNRLFSSNTSAAKNSFNKMKKNSHQVVNQKKPSDTQPLTKPKVQQQQQQQPQLVKRQIKSAFNPNTNERVKSRSTLNLNNMNSSNEHVYTEKCELTSKTCTNFSHPTINQPYDVEQSSTVNTSEQNRHLLNSRHKFTSNLDLKYFIVYILIQTYLTKKAWVWVFSFCVFWIGFEFEFANH